ncbi:MAG: dockerin type I domain-containing protein [Candidatus Zixiibacteriota bacterium]
MKRNTIFLLAVMAVISGSFSPCWGLCPEEPNDPEKCDTLYVEEWAPDALFGPPGLRFVRVPLYVTHDVPNPVTDSIAAFVIPLCFSHTNPDQYCSVSAYWNMASFGFPPPHPRSIFRHLVEDGDTIHNWMMDQFEEGNEEEWALILNLDGTSHFWLALLASGAEDQYFGERSRVLLATMTFKIQDTMHVCIDSCFWPPSSHLSFIGNDRHGNSYTYIPRHNLPHCFYVKTELGRISGTKFNDIDGDCVRDSGEVGLPRWMVTLNPGQLANLTDSAGDYSFAFLPPNTYTISEVGKPYWEQTCPAPPGTYVVPLDSAQTVTGKDFGNRALVNIQDLSITVAGGVARPGFEKLYGISYQNKGTATTNDTVILTLPPEVIHSESSDDGVYDAPTRSVTWNVGDLAPGFIGWLWTRVQIPNTVHIGTILTSTATIEPIVGDTTPADNTDEETQTVRGAIDPNEKLVTPEDGILVTDRLRYQLNFQNVGTDTAFNIVVRDTLDSNLDITTLESGASSHSYVFDIAGRELSWTFANIKLPDSTTSEAKSHGFVSFKVRPRSDAPNGADIQNKAAIYFDFNPPVITNTVHNRIYLCGDANSDGVINAGDVVYLVSYLYRRGPAPVPLEGGDVTRDGIVNAGDVVFLVTYLYRGGPPPCS